MIKPSKKSGLCADRINGNYFLQTDLQGKILSANQIFSKKIDIPQKKLLNQSLFSFLLINNTALNFSTFKLLYKPSLEFKLDTTLINSKKSSTLVRWSIHKNKKIKNINNLLEWTGIEITPLPKEKSLKKTVDDTYKLIFDNNPLPILVFNLENLSFFDVNKIAINKYGYSKKEFLSKTLEDITSKKEQKKLLASLKASIDKTIWIHTKKNGSFMHVQMQMSFILKDNKTKAVLTINEIVENSHEDELVNKNELFYKSLIKNSLDGIILIDKQGSINFTAPSVKKILGYKSEDLIGVNIANLIHPADIHLAKEIIITSGDANSLKKESITIRLKKLNKQWIWCIVQGNNLIKNKHVQAIVIYFEDDTRRKEMEDALKESEIKFKSLFQNSLDVVYVLDKKINIKYVTPSVEQVFGYTEEQIIGKNAFNFIHDEDSPKAIKIFENLMQDPELNPIMDIRLKNSKGKWIWVEAKGINKFNDPIIAGAIFNFHDISDRKKSEQQLQGYSEHITNILNSITDGFIALDNNFNILWWNPIAENLTGIKDVNVMGKNLWKALPELKKTKALEEYKKAVSTKTGSNFELYIGKLKVYFDVNAYPSQQGLFVYFKDITHRKKQEMLLSLEKKVLELNTNPSASLKNTVDFFLKGMEKLNPGLFCSVLLLDENGQNVKHLSAPQLPLVFTKAINGMKIGPKAGSCGTAMHLRKNIIVLNIPEDPLWLDYKSLAINHDFISCWSFPILTSSNTVLGSFAGYYKTKQTPTEEQLDVFNRVATLLGVIIENKHAEQKVNISNERYLLATKATNDAVWDYDIKKKRLYWGESFYTLFGYKPENHNGQRSFWEDKIHIDQRKTIKKIYDTAIKNKEKEVVYAEYHFQKADGKYALITDRAFIMYDKDGEAVRFVGSMQDITERRKLEDNLLKQEIDKQKSIAQAVIDAQEKEREEIGKELHDNVNQILSTAKLYLELAKTDEKQRNQLIKISADSIFNAINEIRSISKALVPASVKDLGLIDSVNDLVESLKIAKVIQVKFLHQGSFENIMSDKQKLMLFRIIQEQVNNVLKHAEATQLTIDLKLTNSLINLSIEDNGKGFELEKITINKGVGLSNIESRANLFNGKVIITTSPQNGCKLLVQVPIHYL